MLRRIPDESWRSEPDGRAGDEREKGGVRPPTTRFDERRPPSSRVANQVERMVRRSKVVRSAPAEQREEMAAALLEFLSMGPLQSSPRR